MRDQRYREHDPILGIVVLRVSDILQTASQATRWYPLDGGIGFGRIRISLLLRHVETKLPPQMLGWDVGTFHFTSDKITLVNYNHKAKIKLRTGGSSGKIPRYHCHSSGNDATVNLSEALRTAVRLPVKHRYRSPVVFELHNPGRHGAAAYAIFWLQHLIDNEDTPIDIPIWTTKRGNRLTQNYVTERNYREQETTGLDDLTEVGRLQLNGMFTPGIDESHKQFVVDNDSRETYETWEATVAEGARPRQITGRLPKEVEKQHEKSLVDGRHVLKTADEDERKRWIDKQGQDWSGAFGEDPRAYTDERGHKVAEPGRDQPPDPFDPPSAEGWEPNEQAGDSSSENGEGDSFALTTQSPGGSSNRQSTDEMNKRSDERHQRGLMQWKPARNAVFARDEARFAFRHVKQKFGAGGLSGREPDIETET